MTNENLRESLNKAFDHFGDSVIIAVEGIEVLYHRIEDWALQIEALIEEGRDEGANVATENAIKVHRLLFKIQQVINQAPLDHFLLALSKDEHLGIRAAAKGNLFERTGGAGDADVVIMSNANFAVMSEVPDLLNEIAMDDDIREGMKHWIRAEVSDFPYDYRPE